MFIVIEGIDGSGKGTQVKLLQKRLEEAGKKVKILDYPRYGEKSCYFVEKYLNGGFGQEVDAKQASLFYALDRYDDSFTVREEFESYDFIISNRYVSANMIHQGGKIADNEKREAFLDWVHNLEFNILNLPKPDMTFFLDISVEKSQELVLQKKKRAYLKNGKKKDLHEDDKEHLLNARNTGLYCAHKYNWKTITLEKDGELQGIEEINNMILNQILIG